MKLDGLEAGESNGIVRFHNGSRVLVLKAQQRAGFLGRTAHPVGWALKVLAAIMAWHGGWRAAAAQIHWLDCGPEKQDQRQRQLSMQRDSGFRVPAPHTYAPLLKIL